MASYAGMQIRQISRTAELNHDTGDRREMLHTLVKEAPPSQSDSSASRASGGIGRQIDGVA